MRIVAHLSDLHFGRIDHRLLDPLVSRLRALQPHVVAVSGDFTQRARESEFREARAFLDRLPRPQVVVPGNHDVPLYRVFERLFRPLEKYRRWITKDLAPVYQDDEIVVAGVNTSRSLTFKGGRINLSQVEGVYDRMCLINGRVTKIIVTHHPFELPKGFGPRWLVGRAEMAMSRLAACGADVFLAGHLHLSYTGHTAERYRIAGHSALVVQAGTATSTRGRGEFNSFNVLRVEKPGIIVERWTWRTGDFVLAATERFQHTPRGWAPGENGAITPEPHPPAAI